jgi:integrase
MVLPMRFPKYWTILMKLTKETVKGLKLPPDKSEAIWFDERLQGFGLRIRAGGKRTWIAQYRLGSKQRRMTMGSAEKLDADKAWVEAKKALAKVGLGLDPQGEKAAARAPKAPELTLADLIDRYLPVAERKLKPGTYSGVVLHLRKHWRPLHSVELKDLTRRHVAAELGRIADGSGLYGANRSRAALSALFAWAIGEGLADANPVVGTNKATEEVPRDRVLSAAELSPIWRHAGGGDYGAIVRLLILTGQRREEVGGILWSEIDAAGAVWRIGAERTKNGLAHDVPLSAPALAVLSGLERREGRDLVFGAGGGPFQGWSNAKSALDTRVSAALGRATQPWRLHDIRRTVATRLADLRVAPHVIEAILNHVSGHKAGVAGVYNRSSYAAEKREALTLWGDHVTTLVEGD